MFSNVRNTSVLMQVVLIIGILTAATSAVASSSDTTHVDNEASKPRREITVWGVLCWPRLQEFNTLLEDGERPKIETLLGGGIELNLPPRLMLPEIPVLFWKNVKVAVGFIPVSVEVLSGKSRINEPHRDTWFLRATGIATGAQLRIPTPPSVISMYIRPRIGFYVPSWLWVKPTEREEVYNTGSLALKGWKIAPELSVRFCPEHQGWLGRAFLDVGYRWLNFDDLKQDPSGDWEKYKTPDEPFVTDIDLTGLVVRAGAVVWSF